MDTEHIVVEVREQLVEYTIVRGESGKVISVVEHSYKPDMVGRWTEDDEGNVLDYLEDHVLMDELYDTVADFQEEQNSA